MLEAVVAAIPPVGALDAVAGCSLLGCWVAGWRYLAV